MRDNWKRRKVSDIGNIITGSTPSTKIPRYWDGPFPFYSPADFKGIVKCSVTYRSLTKAGLETGRILPKNSILFTCIGSIGKMAINSQIGISNQQINALLVNEENNYKFIYYLLFHFKDRFKNFAPKTTIQIINKTEFGKFEFNLPPLPQQKKIANILSTVDQVIEQTESAIAKYLAIKQGLMQDLFTRGIDVKTGQLRALPQDAPELYKESALGLIPREWGVVNLDNLIIAIDPQPDHRTPASVDNGIPYLGINDIDHLGNVNYDKCRRVSKDVLIEHRKRYTINDGDIIFGKIGTIGQPKRLFAFDNLTLSANVILIQPNKNPGYVFWLLNSPIVKTIISNTIHTTSQPAFGMEKIRSLKVPKCDNQEQLEFSKKLNSLQFKIQSEQQSLGKYQQLKAGLMQDLLTGRVGVNIDI
jgi:type I restriction enzyme S subunit